MQERWGFLAVFAILISLSAAQISEPHGFDKSDPNNKFKTRDIQKLEAHVFGTDESSFNPASACPQKVYQHWATEVDASVYSTPVIFDVASDGVKDIVVPTFVRHVEVLDGPHGGHAPGFPFTFPDSAFYASPLIYDINKDGEPDIGMTTFNGELIWLTENGMPIFGRSLKIPHLQIKKEWYVGLKPDPQDMEHTGKTEFEEKMMEGAAAPAAEPGRDPLLKPPWKDLTVPGEKPRPQKKALSGEKVSDLFSEADGNGDGKISTGEYRLHEKSHIELSKAEKEAMFDKLDVNHDGVLELDEMPDLISKEDEQDFKLFDKDGDGKLSHTEFKNSIKRDFPQITDKAGDKLFAAADKDGDFFISKKEAADHWDNFDYKASEDELKVGGVDRVSVVDKALKVLKAKQSMAEKPKAPKPGPKVLPFADHSTKTKKLGQPVTEEEPKEKEIPAWVKNREKMQRSRGGRKLLQEEESGDASEDDSVPIDNRGEYPDGGADMNVDDNEAGSGPLDGREFVDGEDYDRYDDGFMYPDDTDEFDFYDDYRSAMNGGSEESDNERATRIAQEKYARRKEGFVTQPLHAPQEGPWSNLKGFFAPVNEEAQEGLGPMHAGERMRMMMLGHDPIFTRVMSLDKHVLMDNQWINKSAPLPGDRPQKDHYVFVDPHVLCTPIIADLDGDGNDEVIFAVSYYFDREQYSDPAAWEDMEMDVKINKYVAGGVAVYDLNTGKQKWHVHLDLTTDETTYRAYIYSSPSVADLDGDGKLETVLATSLGFIYVLNHDGEVRENFPITMAEIQGQVGIADINDDGQLELVACDNRHNVAAFSSEGKEIWERHVSGFSSQGPTLGDINGDGVIDVVIATTSGHLWALNGKNGDTLQNFPVKTGGSIMSPPLILQMPQSTRGSRHVVVPSHDGYLYFVDGSTGCTFKYDIGENSYSMVIADDVTGNGMMDLVVTTMNGQVICLGTEIKYEAMKSWRSREVGNNNVELRDGRQGIYVLDQYRRHHDNAGATMMLGFQIVDNRPVKGFGQGTGTYNVRISVGGSTILFQKKYSAPGTYLEEIPCPARRQYSTIYVQMTNELGQHFDDRVAMSFNMRFYRALKWILVVPFMLMAGVIVFIKEMEHMLPI